ncbi:hypothetical protein BN14_11068 [Rhizoctonia solani AG-1 IB]|uniref:Uncharacterized protein n=1 Tax=Thanatephorus cucumeris (strain AG1-IB / isolate 7/3/14) TaxID=1108050 RepID=M5CCQ1_THACB|nr:hypothetical protein BN14_11068 [Rhizoctonia solani AG-1 IB]
MPPKSKTPSPPKPVDPLAHLSLVERKALAQPRKQALRTTRHSAGTDDTLPEVAELVSALPKQVQFADKEGVSHTVESDGSGVEDEGKGEGKGEDEGDGVGSGRSDGRDGDAGAGTAAQEWIIIGGVGKYHPRGEIGWRKVGRYYNRRVAKKDQRKWERVKDKYSRMTKRKKPTGDGKGSEIHNAVLHLEAERLAQEETANLDDEEWLDSDAPIENGDAKPQEPSMKSKPNAILAPTPAPFGHSKSKGKAQEPNIIIIDLTDNEAVLPKTVPAKRKVNPSATAELGVKAKTGTTYYAAKVPQIAEVKSTVNRRWDAQTTLDHICSTLNQDINSASVEAAGVAKVEIFGRDRTIEQLKKELTETREQCHQLEHQVDNVVMTMLVYGIPLPKDVSTSGGPGVVIALAEFLRARFPPVVSPATAINLVSNVTPTQPIPIAAVAHFAPSTPTAINDTVFYSDLPINPALYEHSAEPNAPLHPVPSGSNLSTIEKDKLPIYLD